MKSIISIFLAFALAFAYNASAQQVPELMYFRFNQITSGQTPNSAAPLTRLGTATAPVTGLTVGGVGQFGTGLQGIAGPAASNKVDPGWTGSYTGNWTISLWLNVPPPASTRYYFGNTSGGGTFRCFTGGVANDGIRITGGTPSMTLDVLSIQPGPVVITYVYNSAAGSITAYKNGVFEVTGVAPAGFTIEGSNFNIGSQGNSLEGTMDEFRFYNRALTPAEIFLVWDKELPYSSGPDDAGIYGLVAPINFCASTTAQDIKVKIRNYGNNLISNLQVGWSLNGVSQTPLNITTPLDTFGGAGINELDVTLGSHVFTAAPVNIVAWTYLPNSVIDTSNLNDTLTRTLQASLSGTYTINSALPTGGANYQSFTDFTSDLNTYGVCGPVIANVIGGPFVEKVAFGNITGSSAANYIRVNGNGATVQFANTITDRQLLTLSGTKYLTIDSLTFKSLATEYGWAALITGGAQHDSLINCFFDMTSVTSIASGNTNGITFSSSNTAPTTIGNNGNNCYIGNNHVKFADGTGGGYYALTVTGTNDSNVIENNIFENFYLYGAYINGSENLILRNNKFHKENKTASFSTFYGIYTTGITPGMELVGNRIYAPGGTVGGTGTFYGIYSLGDGTPANPVVIANNAIYDVNLNGLLYGIYLSTSPYTYVYHNTIVFDKPVASSATTYGFYSAGTNINTEIKNNNVVITGGTTGIKYGFYYPSAPSITDVQKNNFYINSTQAGVQNYGYLNVAYATQAAFQAAFPLFEVGSPTVDPLFVNASLGNFNVQNPQLIGVGESLQVIVPTDINGNPRPILPTIGAFEQPPAGNNNAGMLNFASPTGSYCSGQQSVSAVINNGGTNNITSVQIHWTVNGVAQPLVNYTAGTLFPITSAGNNSATVVLGNANIPSGTPALIKAWTSMPNGVADVLNNNDTIAFNFQAPHFFVDAVVDSICVGDDAMLSLNPGTGYSVGDLQWQSSTNGTTWTGIANSDDADYTETNLTANKYFRVKIGSGSNVCYSDSLQMVVINVAAPTVVGGERCGPGTVGLSATAGTGTTLKWYEAMTGGAPVATTPSFTTPALNATTNYWVSSSFNSGTDSLAIPLVTGSTSGIYHHMFMVHSIAGMNITSIGIKCMNALNTLTDWDIYYRPDNYQLVPGANTSATGWILLSSVTGVPSMGTNDYTEIALGLSLNIPPNTTYSIYIAPVGAATHNYYSPAMGTITASNLYGELIAGHRGSSLFNCTSSGGQAVVRLNFSSGCESARQMVTATIKPKPVVDLGNDTAICSNANLTLNAGNPGSTYLWNNNSTAQTLNITTAGIYSVTVTAANLCASSDTINVAVGVAPINNLPSTVDLCENDTITLDAGNAGSTYLWSNAATTQTTNISTPGSYDVLITSPDGCPLTSSTTAVSRPLPIVDLGADTAICAGDQIVLNAENLGLNYLWSTGVNTQTIIVDLAGSYSVTVTSSYNCKGRDTIAVTTLPLPTVDAFNTIDLSNEEAGKMQFNAVNPQNVTSYDWDFGDNSTHGTTASPIHVYTSNGTFTVTLKVFNDCGEDEVSFTVTIEGVGIAKLNDKDVNFTLYPNPTTAEVVITNGSADVTMQHISIVNVLGAVVFEKATNTDKVQKLNVSNLASGLYTARVMTDKGLVVMKFEVIK